MSTQPNAISKQSYFGWAWELVVTTKPSADGSTQQLTVSSSKWDPEALRMVFDINMPGYKALWFAKIEIYNMNSVTAQLVITQGATVVLKAGYQTQPYGVVFQGKVYQSFLELEDVTDNKVTLMCFTGLEEVIANFASFSGSPGSTQNDLIANMAKTAFTPMAVGSVSTEALSQTKYPRARGFFGDPNEFIDEVAAANNMVSFYGFNGVNIGAIDGQSPIATITYTPVTGIIGTPQVTEEGVLFRVLMDARVQIVLPAMQVIINNAVIRALPRYPGDYPTILDKDGQYFVMRVNHYGDTRSDGGAWYTQILGATSIGSKLGLEANALDPNKPLDIRSPR